MAVDSTYLSSHNYFKDIAIRNKEIQHSDGIGGTGKNTQRFFSSTLQNFLMLQTNNLPTWEDRCIMQYIVPQRTIDPPAPGSESKETIQFMFFIFHFVKRDDINHEVNAYNRVDECVNQIISRMKHDSSTGNPLFKRAFDKVKGVRITPYELQGQNRYVGSQVSFSITINWDKCYDLNEWLP